MIPNGDLGKGFGLRASLELDKHPEGQRSEVVAKCPSGKKLKSDESDVIMGWPAPHATIVGDRGWFEREERFDGHRHH